MFERVYGGFWGNQLLGSAVFSFFANGGSQCYISRAVPADAIAAVTTLLNQGDPGEVKPPVPGLRDKTDTPSAWNVAAPAAPAPTVKSKKAAAASSSVEEDAGAVEEDIDDDPAIVTVTGTPLAADVTADDAKATADWIRPPVPPVDTLTVTARSKGAIGNTLSIEVIARTSAVAEAGKDGRVDFVVRQGWQSDDSPGTVLETFPDVSMNPLDSRYLPNIINSPVSGSAYVLVTHLTATEKFESPWDELAATTDPVPLAGGIDGTAAPDLMAAVEALTGVAESVGLNVNIVNCNDSAILNSALKWAQDNSAFLVVDPPMIADGSQDVAAATSEYVNWINSSKLADSSYGAAYVPWVRMADPTSSIPGASRLVPPGGAVLGVYDKTDSAIGPHKAPAGIRTALNGLVDVQYRFPLQSTDTLNDNHINCIRPVPGSGICVMGARTLKGGFPDRYISVRRTLIMLRRQLINRTRWAIFEPNGPALWEQLSVMLDQYLMSLMQMGVLKGSTAETSYFVRCDAENNPPAVANAGRVNIDIGLALASPAEFIVIRIGQYEGGADVNEVAS